MSYGRSNAQEILVHYAATGECLCRAYEGRAYCGTSTTDRASLAKRDREFQRKARRWFRNAPRRELAEAIREGRVMLMPKRSRYCVSEMCDSARAIAREEGRAL